MGYSFDGVNKRITLTSGTITVSVRDIWSRWVDWVATSDNSKFLPAFTTTGGEDIDISAGTKIPNYVFLVNGWKIIPQSADHTLTVNDGILLVDGGGDPFNNPLSGSYVIRINYQQPVQAITVSTSGGSAPTAEEVANAVWAHTTGMDLTTRVLMVTKILRNKTITDPTTGIITVYDDDNTTPYLAAQMYEGSSTSQTYRGQGAERRERLV